MKRPKQFNAVKDARRRARDQQPVIPVKRVIPDKRRKPAKHRLDWLEKGLLID